MLISKNLPNDNDKTIENHSNNHSKNSPKQKNLTENQPLNKNPPKSAVDLTTARFRMLVNSEDFARPFEAKIDDNLPKESYSNIDFIVQLSEIAYGGLTDSIVKLLIRARKLFRRRYFHSTYCKYFEPLAASAPLLIYRLSSNPKSAISIDIIVKWYPIFPSADKETLLEREKSIFRQHLRLEFREILLEYYEIVDFFPHSVLKALINDVETHIEGIVEKSVENFEWISEVCKKCGESFRNKTDLINHHDFNACKLVPVHRCQCGSIFMTHGEWFEHCFDVKMDCGAFGWHIWRHKRSLVSYSYSCDGCQHVYEGFLRFWHHICHCPFFIAFLTGNCPFCTHETRLEFYNVPETQSLVSRPHSDKVGIAIVRDWAAIKTIKFNYRLAVSEPTVKSE